MPTTFKHITYEEWLENNPDIAAAETDCEECSGEGEVECFHCGHTYECEECGGTGKQNSSRAAYDEQVLEDERRMQAYLSRIDFPCPNE